MPKFLFVFITLAVILLSGLYADIRTDPDIDHSNGSVSGFSVARHPRGEGEVRFPTDLRSSDVPADYIIVAANEFHQLPSLKRHAEYRANRDGYQCAIINLNDIVKQFPDSSAAQSLRNFLIHAYSHWHSNYFGDSHPFYLLLVGHPATESGKSIPLLAGGDFFYACVTDDNADGIVDYNDRRPCMAVGRLSVRDQTELTSILDKIYSFETSLTAPALDTLTLINGFSDAYPGEMVSDFYRRCIDSLFGSYPAGMAEWRSDGLENARETLFRSFNHGHYLVNLQSHGGIDRLAGTDSAGIWHSLLAPEDIPLLNTLGRCPIVMSYACHTGNFTTDSSRCLGEMLVSEAGGGAVAFIGSLTEIRPEYNLELNRNHFDAIFRLHAPTLGFAFYMGKIKASGVEKYYHLLGDPALRMGKNLPSIMGCDPAIVSSRISYQLSTLEAIPDTIFVNLINYGFINSPEFELVVYDADGDFPASNALAQVHVDGLMRLGGERRVPVPIHLSRCTINRLRVVIDPEHVLTDSDRGNNQQVDSIALFPDPGFDSAWYQLRFANDIHSADTLRLRIANRGVLPARNLPLSMRMLTDSSQETWLAVIPEIAPGDSDYRHDVILPMALPNRFRIDVQLDPDSLLCDPCRENNQVTHDFFLMPDLSLDSTAIKWRWNSSEKYRLDSLSLTVCNTGTYASTPTSLSVLQADGEDNWLPLAGPVAVPGLRKHNDSLRLTLGVNARIAPPGIIRIALEPDSIRGDMDSSNNCWIDSVFNCCDLAIDSIFLQPGIADLSGAFSDTLLLNLVNHGWMTAATPRLRLLCPETGLDTLLEITDIERQAQPLQILLNLSHHPGLIISYITYSIDLFSSSREFDTGDNRARVVCRRKPDLAFAENGLCKTSATHRRCDMEKKLHIVNRGLNPVPEAWVHCSAIDAVTQARKPIDSMMIPNIAAGGRETPFSIALPNNPSGPLLLCLDPNNVINELDETNNELIIFPDGEDPMDIDSHYIELSLLPDSSNINAAIGDIDGDGLPDLLVVNNRQLKLFGNRGGTDFTMIADSEALGDTSAHDSYDFNISIADFNQDSRPDILLPRTINTFENLVLEQDEQGNFNPRYIADMNGRHLDMMILEYMDLDGDGRLDFIALYPDETIQSYRLSLFHNEGDYRFSRLPSEAFDTLRPGYEMFGAVSADFTGDCLPDLFVWGVRYGFFRNNGRGGFDCLQLDSTSIDNNLYYPIASAQFIDIDHDGDLDLLTYNSLGLMIHENIEGIRFERHVLLYNQGDFTTNIQPANGVAMDFNNDGKLEIFMNSHRGIHPAFCVYTISDMTLGDRYFSGFIEANICHWDVYDYFHRGNMWVFGDMNGDGFRDYFHVMSKRVFFQQPNRNNWIRIRLRGRQSHSQGIGAVIRVVCDTLRQMQPIGLRLNAQEWRNDYRVREDLEAHFGIGERSRIDTLYVRWPSGIVDIMTDVIPNRLLTIEEGTGSAVESTTLPNGMDGFYLNANYPNPFNRQTVIAWRQSRASDVELTVYDLMGRCVWRHSYPGLPAGTHRLNWQGTDNGGSELPSGIYFYRLSTREGSMTRRLLILK